MRKVLHLDTIEETVQGDITTCEQAHLMTVERIEWQCPGCQRKFAIPNTQPRPKLCPHCQQTGTSVLPKRSTTPTAAPAYVTPPTVEPELDFAEEPLETPAPFAGSPSHSSRPVKRRRYAELRTLSLVLKIMAGFIGLLTIILLAESGRVVMSAEAGDVRRYLVYNCFGILIGGTTAALLVYAFAVLLVVALDVEYNTRQD